MHDVGDLPPAPWLLATLCSAATCNAAPRSTGRSEWGSSQPTGRQTTVSAPTIDPTRQAWLTRSSELTGLVDRLAIRRDLLVSITDDPVRAPGVFMPSSALITLDAKVLLPGLDPATITFRTTTDLSRYGVVAGVLAHEAGHADHTIWPKTGLLHEQWVRLLEEPRIESVMARRLPHTRIWMQASVAHILGAVDPTDEMSAARVLILLGGRLLGGVLDPHEDLDLDAICAPFLTPEQIAVITEATATVVDLADGDTEGMQACAARIATVMPGAPPSDDHLPGSEGTPVQSGPDVSNPAESNGDLSGQQSQPAAPGASMDAIPMARPGAEGDQSANTAANIALNAVARDAARAMQAAAGTLEPSPQAQLRHRAAHRQQALIARAASAARRNRHSVRFRAPTVSERKAREKLRAALRRAADRGVDVTHTAHSAPPGNLDMAALMQRHAQRAIGVTVTAKPWSTRRRTPRPQPELLVGIAADVSPSQDAVTDPVGVAAWLLSTLTRDRGGKVAAVTWHRTTAALPVGRGDQVPIASTGGDSSGLPEALRALDGLLHLTGSNQARLVVVITDAALPNGDEICGEVQRLLDAGVKVMWLISGHYGRVREVKPPAGTLVDRISDTTTLAETITAAALAALTTR